MELAEETMAWEEELVVECSHFVTNVILQTDVPDRWQ